MGGSTSSHGEKKQKKKTFTVVIAIEEGTRFGAALDKYKNEEVAIVTSIDDDGQLNKWNRMHPAKKVCLGDRIAAVNNCRDDYWEMVAQLWWLRGECKLTVERDLHYEPIEYRRGTRVFLAEYMSGETCSQLQYKPPADCLQVRRAGDIFKCSICLEEYANPDVKVVMLPCNHVFHSACFSQWLKKGIKYCPLCKAAMSDPSIRQEIHDEARVGPTVVVENVLPTQGERSNSIEEIDETIVESALGDALQALEDGGILRLPAPPCCFLFEETLVRSDTRGDGGIVRFPGTPRCLLFEETFV